MVTFITTITIFFVVLSIFLIIGYKNRKKLINIRAKVKEENNLRLMDSFLESIDFKFGVYIYDKDKKILIIDIVKEEIKIELIKYEDIEELSLEKDTINDIDKYSLLIELIGRSNIRIDLKEKFKKESYVTFAIDFFDDFLFEYLHKEKKLKKELFSI